MRKKLDKLFPNWHKLSTFICVNYVILIFKIKVIHVNFIPELSISRQYMSKLKIKLTKLWTGLAGNYTKNLGDFLSSLTTGDSNTNPYWKIERKKGRTISSLHLQCHNLSLSLFLSQAMGFLVGSSCFLHSPLCQSRFLSSSSSSSSSQPMFLYSCTRNAETKKKNIAPMASMHHEDPNHSVHLKRRAILFVGITVLPLLQLKARALEGLATSKTKYQNSLAFKDLHILPLHSFLFYGSM